MENKILYISDLDGTLLNKNCEISPKTAEILNKLIDEKSINFSVATARTSETVPTLTRKIHINTPVIVMNGVATYDIANKQFVNIELLPKDALEKFLTVIKNFGSWGFLYTIKNNALETFFVNCDTPNALEFMKERKEKFGKKFTQVCDFSKCKNLDCVYFSVSHKEEFLRPIYEQIKVISGLCVEFYRDVYNTGFWYLEVCSHTASKYNALLRLKEKYGFEKVISFGDNLNDLPLFGASDECYAVENAKDEVKAHATGIIGSNNNDGVAEFILKKENQ